MKDSFWDYHPIVNMVYFILVIGFGMVLTHPLTQILSLIAAVLYLCSIEGKKCMKFLLGFCFPVLLITAFINPAFNHEGKTILCYLATGNPLTLESIAYGFSAGCMLITIMIWFSNFNRIMTSDKFIYLFGKIMPAMSLVLSMSLRFVPKFKHQMNQVAEAQRSMGRDVSMGSLWQRTRAAICITSIMITWSLENAIETADSMKSRGYGLKGRTAFSIYRIDARDRYVLIWMIFCGIFLIIGNVLSIFAFRYFPSIRYATLNLATIPFYCVYFGMCMTPVWLNVMEERRWKTIYSSI